MKRYLFLIREYGCGALSGVDPDKSGKPYGGIYPFNFSNQDTLKELNVSQALGNRILAWEKEYEDRFINDPDKRFEYVPPTLEIIQKSGEEGWAIYEELKKVLSKDKFTLGFRIIPPGFPDGLWTEEDILAHKDFIIRALG